MQKNLSLSGEGKMDIIQDMPIRPYARLLTMLGEQLIKNERIAIVELIKNSYDADSPWVKLSFCNFSSNYSVCNDSKIIIEDAGCGMNSDIIFKHWLNPATPEKKMRKLADKAMTPGGRVLQGEKGIGRFAILKLGRKVTIITREKNDPYEYLIHYDFTRYDDDFLTEDQISKELFIDDIKVKVIKRTPKYFIQRNVDWGGSYLPGPENGTAIIIESLKGSWNENKIRDVSKDLIYMQSIFDRAGINPALNDVPSCLSFDVKIVVNNVFMNFRDDYIEKLINLLASKSVFRIEKGCFCQRDLSFTFLENSVSKKIYLNDYLVRGLAVFRSYFGKKGEILSSRTLDCGSFSFEFYVFDFSTQAKPKYLLDSEDKKIIKDHRIYLYRDGIRVYPYGEPTDDWLQIDAYRGTKSAGQFLSNDQVVGYVNITQKDNPNLKDKTNREGLIEEGNATSDFIALLQIFLAYIRQVTYKKYRDDINEKDVHDIVKTNQVEKHFESLKDAIGENSKAQQLLSSTLGLYKQETAYLRQRAATTEELAGVGLSVETASHDIMGFMTKVLANIDGIIKDISLGDGINTNELLKELQSIRGGMSFIEAQLKDIQLLFKSSKQRRRLIHVSEIIDKVEFLYRRLLKKEKISFSVHKNGSPLIAKTTDAVLLQLFLNLFDNAVYWLQTVDIDDKKIEIFLDGNKGQLIFSDNGPGVSEDTAPYIFEAFYSGKGEDGRGLGLYIARQLLERNDYEIELADISAEKKLPGANFVVSFIPQEV